MARDYVDILQRVEAHYPQALGSSSSQDAVLKSTLTGFANDLISEIDREQRWSLSFAEVSFSTAVGGYSYNLPFPTGGSSPLNIPTFVDRVWFTDPTSGRMTRLERMDRQQLQRVYGDWATPDLNQGTPRYYSIQSNPTYSAGSPNLSILLYPTPDGNGPEVSGDYLIRLAGYFNTPPIIEVQGSTASNTVLTVPSGTPTFLTNMGEPTSSSSLGLKLSVRTGGSPGIGGLASTHITSWSAFPTATTVTMSTASPVTVSNVQVFFNSTNWIITQWPKLLIFGMNREIAAYYGKTEAYAVWEQRYQDQLKRLRDYEFDLARGMNAHAVAYAGGDTSSLHVPDDGIGWDIRGGS